MLVAENSAFPEPDVWSPLGWVMTPLPLCWVGVATMKRPVEQLPELVQPLAPLSKVSSSEQVPPPAGLTVTEMASKPSRLPLSVTEAVMEWVPTESALVENDAPEPMLPSRLEFQLRLAPRLPSSASLAEAAKPIEVPWTTELLSTGALMFTTGAVFELPFDIGLKYQLN